MSLAQVQLGVAFTMALLFSWASITIVVSLAFPIHAKRAEEALERQPKKCAALGAGMTLLTILGFILLGQALPAIKLAGFALTIFTGIALLIGASGTASLLGKRIGEMSGAQTSFGALVRGAFFHSFAMLFPLLGWFIVLPLSTICQFGAGLLAIAPKKRTSITPLVPPMPQDWHGAA